MKEPIALPDITPDAVFDLGELGCGDLIIALLKSMRALEPGQVAQIRALDPGAAVDIAAWCNMKGNELLTDSCGEDNAYFFIKKGDNS
jgi:tRNA 2-thiouridine synthesizing protein A